MHVSPLIEKELNDSVRILYLNAYSGLFISFIASTGIVFGFSDKSFTSVTDKLIWWFIMVVVLGIRLIDVYYFKRSSKAASYIDLYRFSLSVILTALIWCCYGLYFHSSFSVLELTSIIIIFSALGGGSANILSAHRATCFIYAFLLLIPYSVLLTLSEEHYQNVLGVLGIGFGFVTLIALHKAANFTQNAIHLKNQNIELLELMEQRVELRTQEIYHLSNSDSLTQLLNRNAFLKESKKRLSRYPNESFALLFIDLDGFKHINDTMGHEVGDQILTKTAQRISAVCSQNEYKCRWGGDEFLLLTDYNCKDKTNDFANKIISAITQVHSNSHYKAGIGATIGIAFYPEHGSDLDELILNADMAMYHQKRINRGKISYFDDNLRMQLERIRRLNDRLSFAVQDGSLSLVFQPIIDSNTNRPSSVEALLRWQMDGEPVPPDEFIPIAEQYGMISEIGLWVLKNACIQGLEFQRIIPDLSISVNVSVMQLQGQKFVVEVADILRKFSFPADKLHIEITESVFAKDKSTFLSTVKSLQELGARISIDDFGTGYSSLSSMLDIGVDIVKIDKTFIQDVDKKGLSIVNAVVQMASSLSFDVVAEGVETIDQSEKLYSLGVSHLQGYYFSKPLDASSLCAYLESIKKAS
ncbi:diguanylate phosphodiesterase (plasmid) [Pseudoalteromonas sp. Bsw20308]|uniref:putative bifunctional diguanylate cyclase/phosphodiesterase n=1 Tax=Pseudoalteromonas sp. Bsw20308 TaxID=283699 RepID=UPI0002AAB3F8|nr:EAL domain-containing protein [Pseudoalteromonas sp. Bsw20308]ALQ10243.1 diguanylate phosphodiesterase [Pseudoalteromonas sp. Bsw20308]